MFSTMSMPDVNTLFAGRTVFLTGGSGFVGQVVIEKFLHAVPDVERIYVLVRPAKGKTAHERWAAISSGVLFNRVRADCPHSLDKVVPVEGDITIDDMGLSQENLKRVLDETSVVIHCAATVRFNDTLRSAIELNLKGVERMIRLCKRMPKLESFVHCSTCYVNVDKEGDIEEKQYPVVCDPHKLIEGHGWMTDDMLNGITESMSRIYFNTYCFTKHVAEELVRRECSDLPALIFRPAIIAGIWKDGIPGWADAYQGMTANALGFGTGTVPRMPCDSSNPIDVVPVDVVSNMMIVCAAYRLHLTAQKDRSLPVFHCGTSHLNPFPIQRYIDLTGTFLAKYPLEKFIFAPTVGTRGNAVAEDKLHAFKQHVVGRSLDRLGGMMGKKPFWEHTFRKVREVYQVFIPFVSKRWIYKADNMVELIERMQPEDVEKFDFDVRKMDWKEYTSDFLFGMKTFLTKNDIMSDANLEVARKGVKIHTGVEMVANVLLGWLLSLLITGSFSSWPLALILGFASYYYLNCGMYRTVEIGTIESYRKRMNDAMRKEPLNNNQKA
ncbi:hypothetical protein PRIPAC_80413 [Pristionchus pacificus]|nr:hypothetical protein PRIPAC_80413 [Pristionchus pacificus]